MGGKGSGPRKGKGKKKKSHNSNFTRAGFPKGGVKVNAANRHLFARDRGK